MYKLQSICSELTSPAPSPSRDGTFYMFPALRPPSRRPLHFVWDPESVLHTGSLILATLRWFAL